MSPSSKSSLDFFNADKIISQVYIDLGIQPEEDKEEEVKEGDEEEEGMEGEEGFDEGDFTDADSSEERIGSVDIDKEGVGGSSGVGVTESDPGSIGESNVIE